MSEPTNNQTPATNPAPAPEAPPEKTFTQAELEAILDKRLAKAKKGMPGDGELTEFRAWKESKQTEKERWDTLTKERDTARTDLTAAQAELEQLRREKFLIGKGVPADDVDYYAFKIGKLVTDTVDFKTAAEQYLAQNGGQVGGMRVDFTAPLSGGNSNQTANEQMNNLLRNFRK